jgi:hypothetical protein
VSDPRHYRERLADEVTALVRHRLRTMLPDRLNDAEAQVLYTLISRAVTTAVDELDQREIWRTD